MKELKDYYSEVDEMLAEAAHENRVDAVKRCNDSIVKLSKMDRYESALMRDPYDRRFSVAYILAQGAISNLRDVIMQIDREAEAIEQERKNEEND